MLNEAQFGKYRGAPKFPMQLTMFEQAGTLAAAPQADTLITGRDAETVKAEKLAEADSPGYADKIRESEAYVMNSRWAEDFTPTMDDAPTLAESIRHGGIRRPVKLSLDNAESLGLDSATAAKTGPLGDVVTVADGQHRVAVQNQINPHAEVPVKWDDFRE